MSESNPLVSESNPLASESNPRASETRKDLGVRRIYQVDRTTLGIDWNDGAVGRWQLAHLRRHCPCASCVDEWTRERRLDPEAVAEDLVATKIDSVGRYALRVAFADGHDTGIYTFAMLRELDQSSDRK